MDNQYSTNRILSFDGLKFLAIFFVLWGHAIQYFFSGEFQDNELYRIIYSVHMPLFMCIVGFFAANLPFLSFKNMILKKGRQLLLPTIVLGLIACMSRFYVAGGG